MSVTTRRLAALAAPVLLVGALTACGGSGAPTDASTEAFCDSYNGPLEELTQAVLDGDGEEPPATDIAETLQSQASGLEETGTPEDIGEDARSGFEVYVEQVNAADADELAEAIESGDEDGLGEVSEDEEDDVEAFTEYAGETCGNPLEDVAP